MTKNGWIRENRKDSKGTIRLMDVFYVNGKIKNKHIIKEQSTQQTIIQSHDIKSLYDMILNFIKKENKYEIYREDYNPQSEHTDESGVIKYFGNSTVEIIIDKDIHNINTSVTFFVDNYYTTDTEQQENYKDLLDTDISECKKELKPIFDYLDKNKVKYNFDYEVEDF